jgi:hypothetical protein
LFFAKLSLNTSVPSGYALSGLAEDWSQTRDAYLLCLQDFASKPLVCRILDDRRWLSR